MDVILENGPFTEQRPMVGVVVGPCVYFWFLVIIKFREHWLEMKRR